MKQRSQRFSASPFRRRFWTSARRFVFWIPVFPLLAACAPIATLLSFSQPAVQTAAQVDQIKVVADGVSFVGSGKTVSDHMLSMATGNDCKLTNVLAGTPVCVSECR